MASQHEVNPGDHLYAQHPEHGPMALRVTACGRDGFTGRCAANTAHRLPWGSVLGFKHRVTPAFEVEDEGADGAIVRDHRGRRRFLAGGVPALPEAPQPAPQGGDDPLEGGMDKLRKALDAAPRAPSTPMPPGMVLFLKAGAAVANRPGLALRDTTDKGGHRTKRWMRTAPEDADARIHDPRQADLEEFTGKPKQPPMRHGDLVSFRHGSVQGQGSIVASGRDGVTLKDQAGREHQVRHEHLEGPAGQGDDAGRDSRTGGKPDAALDAQDARPSAAGADGGKDFSAAAHFKEHDDEDAATVAAVLAGFPPDTAGKMAAIGEKLRGLTQTQDRFKKNGAYTPERQALHAKILDHFLSDQAIAGARPPEGQPPTFTILGGRGGSGKSWFKGKVYDPAKAIVLDADEIKGMLPEYKGWNAAEVHEESGDIFDHITQVAMALGLNIVHDATMKTPGKAVALVKGMKDKGYRVEAHYMHLPRAEAAKRAVQRFLGPTGRYVPPDVILGNTRNEETFDQVKELADAWSFRDNQGQGGDGPRLIAQGGSAARGAGGADGRDGRPAAGPGDGGGEQPPAGEAAGGSAFRKALTAAARVLFRRAG